MERIKLLCDTEEKKELNIEDIISSSEDSSNKQEIPILEGDSLTYEDLHKYNTKRCALIAVDEIIDELKNFGLKYSVEWWQEVTQEIEKL